MINCPEPISHLCVGGREEILDRKIENREMRKNQKKNHKRINVLKYASIYSVKAGRLHKIPRNKFATKNLINS